MSIDNVSSLADYARVMNYLESLDPVAAVQVAKLEGSTVRFRIKVRGQVHGLIQTLTLGKTLVAEAAPADAGGTSLSTASDHMQDDSQTAEEFHYRIAP